MVNVLGISNQTVNVLGITKRTIDDLKGINRQSIILGIGELLVYVLEDIKQTG